jgi:hypothetical protein
MVAVLSGDRLWLEIAGGPALACPGAGAPAREDFAHLHPGLLTLPMSAWYPAVAAGPGKPPSPLAPDWRPWPGAPEVSASEVVGCFRHAITRFRLAVEVRVLNLRDAAAVGGPRTPSGRPHGQWVDPSVADRLHVSQLTRKALRLIPHGRG